MFRVKHIYLTLIDRIKTLKNEIQSISLRDFPDDDPGTVVKTLSTIIDCIEVRAKTDLVEDPGQNEDVQKAYLQLANKYLRLLEQVHSVIGVIANGTKISVPWALTRVVREVLKRAQTNNVLVIYAPIWTLNFAIHQHRLFGLYEELGSVLDATAEGKELKKNPPRVVAINFSYLDRKSPLLYGILGHEIGHIFSTEYLIQNEKNIDTAWLEKNVVPLLKGLEAEKQNEFIQTFDVARTRAVEEIGADLFALFCVGPAFVFSVFDMFSRLLSDDYPPSKSSNFYPSNRLRLKVVLDALQTRWDFSKLAETPSSAEKILHEGLTKLRALVEEASVVEESMSDEAVKYAYKYVLEKDIPGMIQNLKTWNQKPFDFADFFSHAGALVGRLENNIPPNQHGVDLNTWADSITILNIAWLSELNALVNTEWKDIDNEEKLSHLHLHDRLCLKAIELAEIQRAYQGVE